MFNSDRLYDHLEYGEIILSHVNFIEQLQYALEIFEKGSYVSYQIRCHYLIAESYFRLEKNLSEAKNIYTRALELAKKIKDHESETKISKQIAKVNDEIRKQK